MKRLALFIVLLFACAAFANFKDELWQSTWPTTQPSTAPAAPWKTAEWSMGLLTAEWVTQNQIREFAVLCRDGGDPKKKLDAQLYAHCKGRNAFINFPGEVVPAGTLLVADYEGMDVRPIGGKPYREVLCQTVRSVTPGYVQYPGFVSDPWWNYSWQSRISEADLLVLERAFTNTARKGTWQRPLRVAVGNYVLVELYLTPADEDERYRAWSILLAKVRRHYPALKVLGLVRGEYAPDGPPLSDNSRHRLARFTVGLCDGVWMWGPREPAVPLMEDIEAVSRNPDFRFSGQGEWFK